MINFSDIELKLMLFLVDDMLISGKAAEVQQLLEIRHDLLIKLQKDAESRCQKPSDGLTDE